MATEDIKRLVRLTKTILIIGESSGRKVGTNEIQSKLQNQNINISIRTIQRDLRVLEQLTQIIKIDECSPMGASINKDCVLFKQLKQQFAGH